MGRLEYDDAGFAYFGIGLGSCFLFPLSVHLVLEVVRSFGSSPSLKARTSLEKRRLEAAEKDSSKTFSKSFYIKLAIAVVGWGFLMLLFSSVQGETGQVFTFDPWEILGLEEGSSESKIKTAYRKLTFFYHPDRNVMKEPEERARAAMMFERIQKAHEILTDKDAYELFVTTGSPDGSKNMEVSIGLPKFLMEKKNHNLVLVVYLLVLVVVTPISVGSWYMNSKLYGDRLILNDTYNMFIYLLDKGLPLKHLPEVLALSAEFRKLEPRGAEDIKVLESLRESMIAAHRMSEDNLKKVKDGNMFQRWPDCDRANVLIHAHLNRRTDELTPGLMQDLDFILRKSKLLLEAMVDTVNQAAMLRPIQNVLMFEQYMTQGLWVLESPLQQLPHVTQNLARRASVAYGISGIKAFLEADEEKQSKLTKTFTPEQIADVREVTSLLPRVKLEVTIGVVAHENRDGSLDFEEKACEGDIMTAYLQLHRNHNLGPVYSPSLPYLKDEEWVVLFCKAGDSRVLAQVKLKGSTQIIREKIQFPSKGFIKPGPHSFDFYLMSCSYVGFDETVSAKVHLHPEGSVKPQELHPDDVALENEPTLFEEAFGRVQQEEDSDFADTDDEHETEDADKQQKSNNKKDDLAVDDQPDADSEPKKKK